ncbi:MAG: GTP-dependent dephospho-CoA kinase family protein [Methanoregulaceae archaeon]|nr:GTP-dependent dephospho-CoA kinase family protein [Methanoregulaceae archaeon]
MFRLPAGRRHLFKTPFGKLYPDIEKIIPILGNSILYTVGDVVTYHLLQRGIQPKIAVIDGHTMRSPCNRIPSVYSRVITVPNPAGCLSDELILALKDAVADPPALIFVEGEEDLAVIPLVIAAPDGAYILYGQPGEGIVLRVVDQEARKEAVRLLALFDEA